MDDMVHHVRACSRARPRALLAADLPYRSYETPLDAVLNARRLLEAGAEAVKAEGGEVILPQVKALKSEGIPFIGHLGMLPQHVLEEGGYRKKGRSAAEAECLERDAHALVDAGAFCIVLELVMPEVAARITASVPVPTVGIGSGSDCDGQILVTHDLVGGFPWFTPGFIRPRVQVGSAARDAVRSWRQEVERQ
jgi:3-methyl-2-oxobutanoate hydroxymethyltransferase